MKESRVAAGGRVSVTSGDSAFVISGCGSVALVGFLIARSANQYH